MDGQPCVTMIEGQMDLHYLNKSYTTKNCGKQTDNSSFITLSLKPVSHAGILRDKTADKKIMHNYDQPNYPFYKLKLIGFDTDSLFNPIKI